MVVKFLKLLGCLIIIQSNIFAQSKEFSNDANQKSNYPISLSFEPIFLLNNTFRFDVEMQQKEKPSAFILGLELINGKPEMLYSRENNPIDNDKVAGVGLSLAYKLKLKPTEKVSSFYVSPGVTLRSLKLQFKGDDYFKYEEDGIEYFSYGLVDKKYPVNSSLFFANIGYQKVYDTNILFDIYLGYGYKISTKDKILEASRNYEEPMYGFNYNGFMFQGGIKLGFQIR